jgi:TRAP-type mannitol/chloroaromatic compound transport system permease small subunit
MAVTFFEVVSRYVFGAPTKWVLAFNQRLFGFYFIIGGAYGVLTKSHVCVDICYKRFPAPLKALVDIVIHPALIFIISLAFMWYGGRLALDSLRILELDYSSPFFPIYPVKVMIPLAGFLLMLQGIAELLRNVMNWRQNGK